MIKKELAYSYDGEWYLLDKKEVIQEQIDNGYKDQSIELFVGEVVRPKFADFFPGVDWMIDCMDDNIQECEYMYDESLFEDVDYNSRCELESRIGDVINKWADEKDIQPRFFKVEKYWKETFNLKDFEIG